MVDGHVNMNTAPREVLRALAAGVLSSDPEVKTESSSFDDRAKFAPRTTEPSEAVGATDGIGGDTGTASLDEAGAMPTPLLREDLMFPVLN